MYVEALTVRRDILLPVQRDPQCFHPCAALFAHPGGVFANAAGKHHGIQCAQRRVIGANVFFYAVTIHIQRKLRLCIACVSQANNFAHVIAATDALKPAFLVKQGFDFIVVHAGYTTQVERDSRVHVATAGAHDQALEWCHTHGCIYALSMGNSRSTGAIAQVQGNQIE